MKKYSKLLITAILVLIFIGCDDHFKDVNSNPNGITDVDPSHLFAKGAIASLRNGISGGYDYRIAGQLGHFYVGVNAEQFVDRYEQDLSGGAYEAMFSDEYKAKLRYYNEIMMLTAPGEEKENMYQYAVADVMAVHAYSLLTDGYGDIPYFEGGFGNSGELSPAYDPQEQIYDDMLARLAEDIETLKTATTTVGLYNQDPIFDDDPDRWVRFANSLRLRLAMRIRHVAPSKANPIIAVCLEGPLMEVQEHNVVMENEDGDNSQLFSPWYSTFDFYNFRISDKIVTALDTANDPRLPIYATPLEDGTYKGMMNGLTEDYFGDTVNLPHSHPNEYLVGKDAVTVLMDAAEIAFLQAECALFGLGGSDAEGHYRRGIELSMERAGVAQEDVDAFMASDIARLSGTQEDQFEQIGNQMWLAFPPNFIEAFATMRRTGYPVIPKRDGVVTSLGVTDGVLPGRAVYPLSEKISNNTNVEKAIARIGGEDYIGERLWWDVRR
jgi:hypothetical protein